VPQHILLMPEVKVGGGVSLQNPFGLYSLAHLTLFSMQGWTGPLFGCLSQDAVLLCPNDRETLADHRRGHDDDHEEHGDEAHDHDEHGHEIHRSFLMNGFQDFFLGGMDPLELEGVSQW